MHGHLLREKSSTNLHLRLFVFFTSISIADFGNDNALSASSSSLFVEAAAADEAAASSSSEEFQLPTFKAGAEVNEFQAEVSRLMDIIINLSLIHI